VSELATERKLIFINLVNGVPIHTVAQTFHRESERVVLDDFRFVALKIKSYMFSRAMPFIPLEHPHEVAQNKSLVFDLLNKVNLDVLPAFSKITSSEFIHPRA
jgi:hypothetical protein